MKLLFLIGNSAVGKMTVGQALTEISGFRLFHNHMTIEPVLEVFGSCNAKVVNRLRDVVFEEFAATDQYGLIFTYMWDFDSPEDWNYIEHIKQFFDPARTEFYYVELVASQQVRLARNITENRLRHKPSKRDIQRSNRRVLEDDEKHRCVSRKGELSDPNYLRIDNTNLTPKAAAEQIKAYFTF